MKLIISVFTILLWFNFNFSQEYVFINKFGKEISRSLFYKNLRNQTRWDSIGEDKIRYAKLGVNRYLNGKSNYEKIKTELEKITKSKIPNNQILSVDYNFKDDLYDSVAKNKWHRFKINSVKRNLKPYIKTLKEHNAFFFKLFESGMIIKTKKNSKKEFFFIDENNFFKENIFINRSMYGSSAAIKPNGEILIYNGEGSVTILVKNLKKEKWDKFFPRN